jgi:hypothetical protein
VPTLLSLFTCDVQAKLNCEVLWDDLALEVRWAVAGETIVLQLVGKIGTTTPYDKFTETLKFKKKQICDSCTTQMTGNTWRSDLAEIPRERE